MSENNRGVHQPINISLPDGVKIISGKFTNYKQEEQKALFLSFEENLVDFNNFKNKVKKTISTNYETLSPQIERLEKSDDIINKYAQSIWDLCLRMERHNPSVPVNPDKLTFDYFMRKSLAEKMFKENNIPVHIVNAPKPNSNFELIIDPSLLQDKGRNQEYKLSELATKGNTVLRIINFLESETLEEVLQQL